MGRFILHARWAVAALVALAFFPAAADASSADVAALQVALRALHLYHGGIDGIPGPGTKRAVRAFQHRHKLAVDGVAGAHTRRALGRRGRPPLGSRTMVTGDRGWDVAALQFLLRKRGFSPGTIDGGYGPNTASTVRRYQSAVGLTADGKAGPRDDPRAPQRRAAFVELGQLQLLARRSGALPASAERPGGRRLRLPRRPASRRHRLPGSVRHPDRRRRCRHRDLRGLELGRLRQPRDRAAPARLPDLVRAPVALRGARRLGTSRAAW